MAIFPGEFIFRFREAQHIEEFLSHILLDDEIRILRSIAYFPFSRRLLDQERHSTIFQSKWMNREQIAMLGIISRKKI